MSIHIPHKATEWSQTTNDTMLDQECVLTHKLSAEFAILASFMSSRQLKKSKTYKRLKDEINAVINGYEYGCYADELDTDKTFYRAILWHLEHGENFKGILETLRNRALVSRADIYFFPGVDVGTWRSQNINVIRDLAIELGYNYYFVPSYLHLDWQHAKVTPYLALEGNAIMSRLPLSNLRVIPLKNRNDPMQGTYKRIGCEKVVLADVTTKDGGKLTLVCVNLPGLTSAWERHRYMNKVLKYIRKKNITNPILIAGDLKTSTYNCTTYGSFFWSVFNKVFRDFDYIIEEHHIYPEKYFEKRLFKDLLKHDLSYETFNEMGVGSFHAKTGDLLGQWLPDCFVQRMIRYMLSKRDEAVPFKYDWFVANAAVKVSARHEAERPKVISHLFKEGRPISRHDPVLLDFEVVTPMTGDVAEDELKTKD
ncbi:MAG: hypothetical protein ABII18_06105 [bacterium]|nr:hypothetical protein [bacterium]MBU1917195.1 hypothetical protein [bacterium]